MEDTIRILLAEDHPIVRRGMRDILDEHADLQLVGEVDHGRDIEPAIQEQQPDILLLDLRMPDLEPAPLTRCLAEKYPELRVLVLTAHDDPEFVVGLLSAGAVGYVLKDEASDTLVAAIRAVAQGKNWFSDRVTQQLVRKLKEPHSVGSQVGRDGPSTGSRHRLESLTQRELDVLTLIGQGADNGQIAEMLSVTKRTAETYVQRVYDKLGIRERSRVARYAVEHGLVDERGSGHPTRVGRT